MKETRKPPFNVNKFLASVDGGRTMSNYGKNQTPTTLQADESNGGLGTNGHRYVEGVTPKQLPARLPMRFPATATILTYL